MTPTRERLPMDRFSRLFFLASLMTLSILYGSFAAMKGWFPANAVRETLDGYNTLVRNWRNDFELEPTRHIVDAEPIDRVPYTVHNASLISDGDVLVAGLSTGRDTLHGVTLFGKDGEERHHWNIDYSLASPDGLSEFNVLIHGVAAYPDGSVIVAFDAGDALARYDACGALVWAAQGRFHHVVDPGEDGTLWTWRKEVITQIDARTGEELNAIDLRGQIIRDQNRFGALAIRTQENKETIKYVHDPVHANDVEVLSPDNAAAFDAFDAGDLLISLRELNLLAVVDPDTHELKWYRHGPWFKQHDPDFQSDGTITVFDNRMGLGGSEIVAIDPDTDTVTTLLASTEALPFYSWRRGKHQIMDNGHLLVTESERGRVFETTAGGQLVWEREMIFNESHNTIVTSAEHLPPDFFEPGALNCSTLAASR